MADGAPVATRVELWQWPLAGSARALQRWRSALSPDESARAARFVRPADADAFVVGRGMLRQILGQVTGLPPQDLVFDYGAQGRPSLRGAAMPLFNLSHSGGRAVLAVADDGQPGVDIEWMRPVEPAVAWHHFSQAENWALAAMTGAAWQDGFFRCWTRKEAVLKAHGDGLALPLSGFDVSLDALDACVLRMEFDDARAWRLAPFEPAPGYVGAVALRGGGPGLRLVERQVERADLRDGPGGSVIG
ncbi:MAG: 4'-phosphopantetheinyl transferase superfamily protein [Paracoccaceae bacterium]